MKLQKLLFASLLLFLPSLSSCGGNYPLTISRDFDANDVKAISIDYYDNDIKPSGKYYYYFYQTEFVQKVYDDFSTEYVKKENRVNYKTDINDCLWIYNVIFQLNSGDSYEIKYYVYSHVDGTVVYPNGIAHAFYGNAKNEDLAKRLDEYKQEQVKNKEFVIQCVNTRNSNEPSNLYFKETSGNKIEAQLFDHWYIHIHIPDKEWVVGEDNLNLVTLEYTNKIDLIYSSSNDYSMTVSYGLYPMEKFDDEQLKITYHNKTYVIDISSTDYDFSNAELPSLNDLEGDYSPFKEMIDSIRYHEFTSPFPGRDPNGSYGGSSYWNQYTYTHSFDEQYDTNYVNYLTDSIYYPTEMDMAWGDIGDRSAKMTYNDINLIKEGTPKTTIPNFEVGYSVVDPDCTRPTNALGFIYFQAVAKDLVTISELTNKAINLCLHKPYYLLKDVYPEHYYQYKVNDLNISIIMTGDTLQGYFEDETYAYMLSCGLNSDVVHVAV